jgi:hypothetical protein
VWQGWVRYSIKGREQSGWFDSVRIRRGSPTSHAADSEPN